MLLLVCLVAIASLSTLVRANTEKVIFTAPDNVVFGDVRPNLSDLRLDTFTPTKLALRTALPVAFPTEQEPRGLQSWYLLENLTPGQRYEVRICWPATQPTQFWLETYNITHVFDDPPLIQGLAAYAEARQNELFSEAQDEAEATTQSALFLRIWSAADYFTTNQRLMNDPDLVDVEIILDPFLFNIFPQSLLPTAAYIILIGVGGWFLSSFVWKTLDAFLEGKEHTD